MGAYWCIYVADNLMLMCKADVQGIPRKYRAICLSFWPCLEHFPLGGMAACASPDRPRHPFALQVKAALDQYPRSDKLTVEFKPHGPWVVVS